MAIVKAASERLISIRNGRPFTWTTRTNYRKRRLTAWTKLYKTLDLLTPQPLFGWGFSLPNWNRLTLFQKQNATTQQGTSVTLPNKLLRPNVNMALMK